MKPKHKLSSDPKITNNLILRLRIIEGQIRGIQGMIEREEYCDDVLNQLSPIKSAGDGMSKILIRNHIQTGVIKRFKENDSKILEEFMTTINHILK
ncbi:metal-sensing transcriptional repressor [Leptospira borgpetersenii]|uniref:metal-sensing transcriptional repressor n=1 Tax=Leptospira borgpetersenii TaxID=174 RepID=UPI001880F26B|nr:metal-sensing transcriptional repressor [Leptospira borgpetersenii]MBE8364091.1 metal-sensing transcriptional repressor [Leptospira borgpetersenii serovar Balcanica]MBE8366136.1 metal-sensing transcriptional repressor [Leptospira borgpetersenii serovar Balcanica]MBE8423234.1 metal-sensing transcriptional repressor [Leptospira borgpetersenii serovar Balcanica]MBF3350485.1 metal-sensing transcriptional repressor [Leptospira borgpetersenii serovar Balcanica]